MKQRFLNLPGLKAFEQNTISESGTYLFSFGRKQARRKATYRVFRSTTFDNLKGVTIGELLLGFLFLVFFFPSSFLNDKSFS
jgi:hypothetical protein